MSPFWGEVLGTMVLIWFGAGVCAGANLTKSYAKDAGWVVITLAWGLGVTLGIYAVGGISGAHLNPAVTVALASAGDFAWSDVPLYILGQFIGAFLGASIIFLQYLPHWRATSDAGTKLGVFSTGPAIPHTFSNLLSEFIGTFVLLFGLQFIGAGQFTEGLNPIAVGLLIVAIGMAFGGTTGYAINPARDLGPRIAHAVLPIPGKGSSNWGYSWVPVVGPILGGAFGALFYKVVFTNTMTTEFWIVLVVSLVVLGIAYFISPKNLVSSN